MFVCVSSERVIQEIPVWDMQHLTLLGAFLCVAGDPEATCSQFSFSTAEGHPWTAVTPLDSYHTPGQLSLNSILKLERFSILSGNISTIGRKDTVRLAVSWKILEPAEALGGHSINPLTPRQQSHGTISTPKQIDGAVFSTLGSVKQPVRALEAGRVLPSHYQGILSEASAVALHCCAHEC